MKNIVKLLVISDVFLLTGFGLISPILAVFIKDNLIGGSILAAGIASMMFVLTKSILQLIFAKIFNPKDRLWMVILGTFLIATVPFIYIFCNRIEHIYIAQIIHGIGSSFTFPSWMNLFTKNLSKKRPGFEWSIYSAAVGIGTAIAAYAGAWLAQQIGFRYVFAITGVLAMIGATILIRLTKEKFK